jgi:acetyl esterase/lipase
MPTCGVTVGIRLLGAVALACGLVVATGACSGDGGDAGSGTVPRARAGVEERTGIVYGHGTVGAPDAGPTDLLLDLYEPKGDEARRRPVVVLVHGGGFMLQSRADAGLVHLARALARRGIVAVSIDYRLQPTEPVPSARVAALSGAVPATRVAPATLAAIDDTLTAIEYLGAHAEDLRIDPDRLGLIGSSAGAFTVDAVAFALDDHGITRPAVRFVASLWGGLIVAAPGGSQTRPVDQVEPGEPALFAVHGDEDGTVPVRQSDDLTARAERVGITTEYHRIPGGGHGHIPSGFSSAPVAGEQTAFDRLLAFAEAQLAA